MDRSEVAAARRVLVVEDDQDIRWAVAESLSLEGYTVATAADGKQALELAHTARPDVIVLDLMMPVMDGWTFVAQCKARPWCREVPIVVVSSAHLVGAAVQHLHDIGVCEVIAKPFDLDVLIGMIRRYAP